MEVKLEKGEYTAIVLAVQTLMDTATVDSEGKIVWTLRASDVIDEVLQYLNIH